MSHRYKWQGDLGSLLSDENSLHTGNASLLPCLKCPRPPIHVLGDRHETGSMEDLNAIVLDWEALDRHRPKGHLKHPCSFSLHLPVVP